MRRVVIVGAGISGLTAAYRLCVARPDVAVTVLEADDRPGGKIRTENLDGFRVEWGPNGFLDSKRSTLELARELGLQSSLVAASESARKNRYLFLENRLVALPASAAGLLRSPVLSLGGKLRLLTEPFRGRSRETDESAASFARRRLGREAAATLFDAAVTGIHAADPELLSLPAAFPRLAAMERDSGSLFIGLMRQAKQRRAEAQARGEPPGQAKLWSFRHGLGELTDRLAEKLPTPPVCRAAVTRIERRADGWTVHADSRKWDAEAVVLTCPPDRQAAAVADLDGELAAQIGSIKSNKIAVVAVGYRESDVPSSYDGFGFIAPQSSGRDILGVQWCSAIYPGRAPEGYVLWRALCGGWNRPELVDWPDLDLLEAVRIELRLATGVRAVPAFARVVRWQQAIPQYHVGHLDKVAKIEVAVARHPGLFVGGNAYHGVALNDCTDNAGRVAAKVSDYFDRI